MPDIVVNKQTMQIVTNWPALNSIPPIFARKMDAMAKNAAVPFVLILVPIGSTKRVTRESMPNSVSATRNVTGNVAALLR